MKNWKTLILFSIMLASCSRQNAPEKTSAEPGSFGDDIAFLRAHTDIRVLDDGSGGKVAVAPAWQGRVMTSTADDDAGESLGWIHRDNIKAGILPEDQRQGVFKHIHIFGGEERFWLGPEGGQVALFFPPDVPYEFENWKTPAVIDTEAFDVVAAGPKKIEFRKETTLSNRAGTKLTMGIDRAVEVLDRAAVGSSLGVAVPDGVKLVGYRTTNVVTNKGTEAWTKDGGLVSIWLLGMFKHGADVTVVVPLRDGPRKAYNDDYFGPVGPDRVKATDKAVFFKGDGAYRSKIGVPPDRSTGVTGSYDPDRGQLTIVRCDLPDNAAALPYVRSQWQDHVDPYAGDLINSYNDGPVTPGEPQLGPFYELETSSPALPLAPGESMRHVQDTIHLKGSPESLDPVARKVFGVSLEEIQAALKGK